MLEWASQFDKGNSYIAESFFFFFSFLVGYFILYRMQIRHLFINKVQRTKAEQKKHEDELWFSSTKEQIKRFFKWLLCRSYTKEQKGRGYGFFVFFNYFYLILGLALFLLWICSLFIPLLRIIFVAFSSMKMTLLDAPLLLLGCWVGIKKNHEYRRQHKWDIQ